MIQDGKVGLQFFVSPNIQEIVEPVDLSYIEDLLADLLIRSQTDAQALHKQLLSLSVRPLIIQREGTFEHDDDYLNATCARFVPLGSACGNNLS